MAQAGLQAITDCQLIRAVDHLIVDVSGDAVATAQGSKRADGFKLMGRVFYPLFTLAQFVL